MLNLVGGNMGSSSNLGHPQQARLFVGDLKNAEKADIEAEFSTCGSIKEIWMAHNPPGFAFVEFFDRESALKALKKMNGATIKGDKLRVEFSKNRKGTGGFRGTNNNSSPFMGNGPAVTACYYTPNRGGPVAPPPSAAQAPPPPHYQYPPPFATAQGSPFAPGPLTGRPPSPPIHLPPGPTLADYHHGPYATATAMYAPYGVPQVDGTSPLGNSGPPHYAATASPNDYYQAAAAAHLKSLQQAPQAAGARMSLEEYDRYYRAAAAVLGQQPPPTDPYGQPIPTGTSTLAPPAPNYPGNGGPPLVNDYRDYYLTEPQQHKRYPDEMGGAPHYAAHHMDPNMRSAQEDPYGMRYKYRTEGPVSDDYERYLRSLYPPPPGAMPGTGGPIHHPTSPNGAAGIGGRKYSATSRYRTASPSPPKAGGSFRSGGGGGVEHRSSPPHNYSPGPDGRGSGRRDESPPKYRYYDPYYDSYYRDYRHHGHGRPGGSPPLGSSSSKDLATGSDKRSGVLGTSSSIGGTNNPATSVSSAAGYHNEYHNTNSLNAARGGPRVDEIMGMVGGDATNRVNAIGSGGGDTGKSRQIKNGGVLVTARRDTNERGGGGASGDFYYEDKNNNRAPLAIHDGQRR